ncbi:MAG: hypothetical protein U0401_28585 [Anaerolineae bacterium]
MGLKAWVRALEAASGRRLPMTKASAPSLREESERSPPKNSALLRMGHTAKHRTHPATAPAASPGFLRPGTGPAAAQLILRHDGSAPPAEDWDCRQLPVPDQPRQRPAPRNERRRITPTKDPEVEVAMSSRLGLLAVEASPLVRRQVFQQEVLPNAVSWITAVDWPPLNSRPTTRRKDCLRLKKLAGLHRVAGDKGVRSRGGSCPGKFFPSLSWVEEKNGFGKEVKVNTIGRDEEQNYPQPGGTR